MCSGQLCVDGGGRKILGEELPALAKEVARVEMVRAYAGEFLNFLRYSGAFNEFQDFSIKFQFPILMIVQDNMDNLIRDLLL